MKVGITGVNGFLGLPLAQKLLDIGHRVVGVDDFFRPMVYGLKNLCQFPNFEFVYGDICDKTTVQKAFSDVDYLFHLAALVGEPVCKQFINKATQVNVVGTQTLVDNTNTNIIYHGTGSSYGKISGICTELSPANAISHYGETKKIAEDIILKNKGIVLRLGTAFGLSLNHRVRLLINDLTERAVNDRVIVIFQADYQRSFVHIQDILDADLSALENFNKMSGEVFNVSNPDGNWTKRQLAEYLKKKTGCHIIYAEDGYQDPDQRNYGVSVEKIRPYWQSKVSLETGIDELIRAASVDSVKY
jgi:nucleoside-diphosphate-sugar epimerase